MSDFSLPKSPSIVNPALLDTHINELGVAHKLGLRHLWVIYNHKENQVVYDPMTRKPVNNRNRQLLESIVKEIGHNNGKLEIMTAHDAFVKIMGKKPSF